MLFWSMFMEVGGRFSVDAWRRSRAGLPRRDLGWALPIRMAQLQFAWIYLDSVVWKLQGQYWAKGEGPAFRARTRPLFTRPLGAKLFNTAWFIVPGSYYSLGVEAAFLFLVFAPFWQPRLRAVALVTGFSLHGGIWLLMNVGNFAYIMPATYPLFFEPAWGRAYLRRRAENRRQLAWPKTADAREDHRRFGRRAGAGPRGRPSDSSIVSRACSVPFMSVPLQSLASSWFRACGSRPRKK